MDELVSLLRQPNADALGEFLSKQSTKVLTDWDYGAATSDHRKLASHTLALAKALESLRLSDSKELKPIAAKISSEIIRNHTRIIYRCLSLARPAQTIPALNLLTTAAILNPVEVYNSFDFTLKIIPKLLGTAGILRKAFISFFGALVAAVPPSIRRDIPTTNRKIWALWAAHIAEDDDKLIQETLELWRTSILRDNALPRVAKATLFNDRIIKDVVKLLSAKSSKCSEEVHTLASKFIVELATDTLKLDAAHWYEDSVHNRQALALLKLLKPWDNTVQMDTTCRILKELLELVEPYFQGLADASFSLAPKNSMFWFSFTVLHARVIGLDLPRIDGPPIASVVAHNALPPTASRAHLQAGLSFNDSHLVQFQTAQVVFAALNKLRTLQDVYQVHGYNFAEVLALVSERLPDYNLLLQPRPGAPELLQTVCLSCARLYARLGLLPASTTLPAALLGILDDNLLHGLDLIRAQDILEIETFSGGGPSKWWNKVKGSNSLFTKLVKFTASNPSLANQTTKLIEFLVQPTLAFCLQSDSGAIVSPVDVLVYTFSTCAQQIDNDERQKLWALLDESISRCVRVPYPYIDKYPTTVSPLATALVEQLAHVQEPKDGVSKCVTAFVRNLLVAGEDAEKMLEQLDSSSLDFARDDYFEFVLSATDEEIMTRTDLVFKMESSLDIAATTLRITKSPELADHLLASIRDDMAPYLATAVCAKRIISCSEDVISRALAVLKLHDVKPTPELARELDNSPSWPHALKFLSTEKLIQESPKDNSCIIELTGRNIALPGDVASKCINTDALAGNIRLWEDCDGLKEMLQKTSNDAVACVLVEKTRWFDKNIPTGKSPRVLAAAARFVDSAVDYADIKSIAVDLTSLPLYATFASQLDDEHSSKILKLMESIQTDVLNSDLAILASVLEETDATRKYLKRVVLHLTKHYAENKPLEDVRGFNQTLVTSSQLPKIWTIVPSASINALLEAGLKRAPGVDRETLELFGRIIAAAPRGGKKLTGAKHLQLVLELPSNPELALEESMLLWLLFDYGHYATKEIQQGILLRYNGSCSASDSLLLDILKGSESELKRSWVEDVELWEFRTDSLSKSSLDDYELDPLVTVLSKSEKTLRVTFDKSRVASTVYNYDPSAELAVEAGASYDILRAVANTYKVQHPFSGGYSDEFLLNALVSCDYIFKPSAEEGKPTVDLRVLADSGSLGYVLCALGSSNANITATAYRVLLLVSSTLGKDEAAHKEHTAMRLCINKVLTYMAQAERENLPGYMSVLLASLMPIVTNPGHFLHEKLSDWLLSGPSIQTYDLPLYQSIMNSQSDHKPRELVWLVRTLTSALVDAEAVNVYLKHGIFDWAMSQAQQTSSKAATIKRAVKNLLDKASDFGAFAIISRAGGIATEAAPRLVASVDPTRLKNWLAV